MGEVNLFQINRSDIQMLLQYLDDSLFLSQAKPHQSLTEGLIISLFVQGCVPLFFFYFSRLKEDGPKLPPVLINDTGIIIYFFLIALICTRK